MHKMNQKRFPATPGILFVLALSVCLVSCLGWIMEQPSFTLHEISISPKSLEDVNLILGLDVYNPNRFDMTLTSFEYVVQLNHEEVGTGRLEKEILLPSSSNTQVQALITAKFKNLGGSLKTLITSQDLPYKIEGNAAVKTAVGSSRFTFSREGNIK
jgi:LEA14-like dessication related protein